MKHKCTNCGHVDVIKAVNQSKGGKARWKGTTKKDRSEAASKAAKARWSRRNGTAPVKPGSKPRGRPRKGNTKFRDAGGQSLASSGDAPPHSL